MNPIRAAALTRRICAVLALAAAEAAELRVSVSAILASWVSNEDAAAMSMTPK